jgi:hypothetical protein
LVALVAMVTAALLAPAPGSAAIDDLPPRWTPLPRVITNGEVNAIARHPGTGLIVIGGAFDLVCQPDGECRRVNNLAILSAPDRLADPPWLAGPPRVGGEVYALAITGSPDWQLGSGGPAPRVWVGGRFDHVNGQQRSSVFGFDLLTRELVDVDPLAGATSSTPGGSAPPVVKALAVGPERKLANHATEQQLYIGGSFRAGQRFCGDDFFAQENLANFTIYSSPEMVRGKYNDRWTARPRSPVTSLAVVPPGPWQGLLVATAHGVEYGSWASGSSNKPHSRGPVALLTGTTGAPHSWQPKISADLTRGSAGVGHLVVDEDLASSALDFGVHVSGHFRSTSDQEGPPGPDGRRIFGRLEFDGSLDRLFDQPAGDGGVVPGALALAGQVRGNDGTTLKRWLVRATNHGLVVVDALSGRQASTIEMQGLGQEAIRSVLAVPGFGIMVAGKFDGNVAFFAWPAGRGDQRVRRRTWSSVRKRRARARSRFAGTNRKAPMRVFGRRVDAIEPYPGGVAIGGDIDRVCPAGQPITARNCEAVGGIVGLEPNADSVQWKARVQPKRLSVLRWIAHTRTLLVGGAFNQIETEFRRDLAELEIPHGSSVGPVTVTPMDWLGRQVHFRRLAPWPDPEGVSDIDYDVRTWQTTVVGNFATGPYVDRNVICAHPAMRIMRLTPDMRPDSELQLQLGDEWSASTVSSVASFSRFGRAGYVLGGNFGLFRVGPYFGPVGNLLVVDWAGSPLKSYPFDFVDQIDEVHTGDGQTTAMRALARHTSGGQLATTLLNGRLAQLGVDFSALPWFGIMRPTAIEGAPNGSYFLAGPDDAGRPTIVRLTSGGSYLETVAMGTRGEITRLVLSPDGRYLYVAGTFERLGRLDSPISRDLFTAIPLRP